MTYTGATNISAGNLQLNVSNAIPGTSTINISGGTLALGTSSELVNGVVMTGGSITGSTGILTSNSDLDVRTGTISAIYGGSTGAVKTTAGNVTFSGVNTTPGATNVSVGILKIGNSSAAGFRYLRNDCRWGRRIDE